MPGADSSRLTRASITIARAFGIPIRVHVTFLVVVVWFGFHGAQVGHAPWLAVLFLLALFGCVALHELGHAGMARGFGVRTHEIVLYPFGGIARVDRIPAGHAELWIALAGPVVNLALAVLLGLGLVLLRAEPPASERLLAPSDLVPHLAVVNGALFLFNLLPAFPMDGGRVLRAALSFAMPTVRATEIAAAVGQGVAILFGLAGLVGGNYVLVCIGLFVFVGARQESASERARAAILGRTAGDAMVTRFETLAPQDSLRSAAERLLATPQGGFPVIDAWQRVVGILSRDRLLGALAQHGGTGAVLEVMEREPALVAPEDDLERVLQALRRKPGCPVLVHDGARLLGLVTLESIVELVETARRAKPAAT